MIDFKADKIALAPIHIIPVQMRKHIRRKVDDRYVRVKLVEKELQENENPMVEEVREQWIARLADAPDSGNFTIYQVQLGYLEELQ